MSDILGPQGMLLNNFAELLNFLLIPADQSLHSTEKSQHLTDRLAQNFVKAFMVPRG